ncbi:sperm-associated microtubule inner protein 4 [Aulostomus maculatus]
MSRVHTWTHGDGSMGLRWLKKENDFQAIAITSVVMKCMVKLMVKNLWLDVGAHKLRYGAVKNTSFPSHLSGPRENSLLISAPVASRHISGSATRHYKGKFVSFWGKNNYTFPPYQYRRDISQHYSGAARKKSKLRLNDQLIPKPSDINLAEKMIHIAAPKEHPYASHISRFAVFPTFRSPDDPNTGVRAVSQTFPGPLIPASPPDVTLLSKTKGGPYRHEIIATPMRTRRKAVTWAGEHGFLDHAKPMKGKSQVMYPTPLKAVLPNPRLRDWDLSISERTSNMLRNLERTLWITSYQMHYTGSGPANPLKIDDFKEKMSDLTGTSYAAPLRERSHPVFVPSKPKEALGRRQRRICNPTAAEPPPNPGSASVRVNQARSQEITAEQSEASHPNKMGQSQSASSSGSTEAGGTELSHEVLHKQSQRKSSECQGRETETCKVHFGGSLMQDSTLQNSQEANAGQITDTQRSTDVSNRPHPQQDVEFNRGKSSIELCDERSKEEEYFKVGRIPSSLSRSAAAKHQASAESQAEVSMAASELPLTLSNTCIRPRPPVLPGIHPTRTGGPALRLLDLQHSFSKSEANRNFNKSITRASVNLGDNKVTGRKHDFYGINCTVLRG